jgi:hypothetical protein
VTEFPRLVDDDSVVARLLRVERAQRKTRRLLALTACCLAVLGLILFGVMQRTAAERELRFCRLAGQAIVASTPEKPIDPFLLTLYNGSDCPPLARGVTS